MRPDEGEKEGGEEEGGRNAYADSGRISVPRPLLNARHEGGELVAWSEEERRGKGGRERGGEEGGISSREERRVGEGGGRVGVCHLA